MGYNSPKAGNLSYIRLSLMLDGKRNSRTFIFHEFQAITLNLPKSEVPIVSPARLKALARLCLYDASLPLVRVSRLMLASWLSNEDHIGENSNGCKNG